MDRKDIYISCTFNSFIIQRVVAEWLCRWAYNLRPCRVGGSNPNVDKIFCNVHCGTSYSRSRVNHMGILKNSKELLEHLQSPNLNHITSIKSFDFSTFYTTIPHQKLKSRLATIIRNSFIHKNWNRRFKFLVLGREGPYFVKEHSDSKNKYTEDDIINMLEFLVDNMFWSSGERFSNR